jgi:hypothetical protein
LAQDHSLIGVGEEGLESSRTETLGDSRDDKMAKIWASEALLRLLISLERLHQPVMEGAHAGRQRCTGRARSEAALQFSAAAWRKERQADTKPLCRRWLIGAWIASPSPGHEQRLLWGSQRTRKRPRQRGLIRDRRDDHGHGRSQTHTEFVDRTGTMR